MLEELLVRQSDSTIIETLSLHDALPICSRQSRSGHLCPPGEDFPEKQPAGSTCGWCRQHGTRRFGERWPRRDRKSTRLNSSHGYISYAVSCLKKKRRTKPTCAWKI